MNRSLGVIAAVLAGALVARGQEDFRHVYRYETPLAGWAEATLWTTYIPTSDLTQKAFGRTQPREGLWAHSAEAELGLTDHLAAALYADFEDPAGRPMRFTEGRVEARYRFNQPHDTFFDTAVDAEYYLPRGSFSDEQDLETRAILQHDFGDLRFVVNPMLTFPLTGDKAGEWPDAAVDAGVYYRRSAHVQPGIELYEEMGKLSAVRHKRLTVMPVVSVLVGRHWWWQLGAGRGVDGDSDRWVLQSMLRFEFDAVKPQDWFSHGSARFR